MANHARRLDVFEVFDKFEKAKTRKEKIQILQENDCAALRDVCRGYFDDIVQWNLPEGRPPFTPNIPQSVPSTLLKQNRQFKYFVKGLDGDSMPAFKREKMFISLLESVHPMDAEILISMVNKKPTVKGLTKKLVEEAFPKLIVR